MSSYCSHQVLTQLDVGKGNPMCSYRMGHNCLGSSSFKKDASYMADHKLNTSQQCAIVMEKKKVSIWDCRSIKCIACKTQEVMAPFCPALVGDQLEYYVDEGRRGSKVTKGWDTR